MFTSENGKVSRRHFSVMLNALLESLTWSCSRDRVFRRFSWHCTKPDLIEESVVTQWGTHVSKKYVDKETSKKFRNASEPFLKVKRSLLFHSLV
jgi:hypothetical protein